jgi:trimeric autotransporter adhesin
MNLRLIAVILLTLLIPGELFSAAVSGQVIIWGTKLSSGEHYAETVAFDGKPIANATAISAGRNHALVLRADGSVVGWGINQYGQTNVPAGLRSAVAVAAGEFFSLALDSNGNVSAWGGTRIKPGEEENAVAISAGSRGHALALRRDGEVFSWSGKGGVVPRITNIVAIAAGGGDFERNLALRNNGTVVAWGDEYVPEGLSNVTAIAVGEYHSLALKKDGTVYGWGDNHCGQATGIESTNGQRRASGLVVHSGQVLSNVVAIAAGNQYGLFGIVSHHSLALKKDGTVVGWGRICGQPVTVPEGLSNVVAIAAGQTFCLAITTNAAVAERFRR